MQMFLDKLQWRQSEVGPRLRLMLPQPSWIMQIWHLWMGDMQLTAAASLQVIKAVYVQASQAFAGAATSGLDEEGELPHS